MTLDARIAELADTIQQLRAEDACLRVFGAAAHRYQLHPPLSEAELQEFEAAHGIQLPQDYRLFLHTVGNGGTGPAYGLQTLAGAAKGVDPRTPFPFSQRSRGYPDEVLDRWSDEPFGVLEICSHGCAIYSYLVVNGAAWGTIWDGEGVDVEPTEQGFLEWYARWAETSLRNVRNEQLAQALRVGMTTNEVMQTVPAAWKKRESTYDQVTFFEAPGIPAQLQVDENERVTRITPWPHL